MPYDNTIEFDSYKIYYFTPAKSGSSYGPKSMYVPLFKGSVQVGQLQFYPDAYVGLPKDYIWNTASISLYLRERQFDQVMTIIREEKPLYIHLRTDVNTTTRSGKVEGLGQIMTSQEPAGEEEGV